MSDRQVYRAAVRPGIEILDLLISSTVNTGCDLVSRRRTVDGVCMCFYCAAVSYECSAVRFSFFLVDSYAELHWPGIIYVC